MKTKSIWCFLMAGFLLAACDNDDNTVDPIPPTDGGSGQVTSGNKTNLDVSQYDTWTYVNLKTGQTETHPDFSEWVYSDGSTAAAKAPETIGIDWHIAIHRYEVRTNEASVLNTKIQDMNQVKVLPEGTYKPDEQITNEDPDYAIVTDMTHMMDDTGLGVAYAKTATINRTLCGWVEKKKTGAMPPVVYTPTKNVMAIKLKNGDWAKVQFTAAGNTETGKSGFVTFNYEYLTTK